MILRVIPIKFEILKPPNKQPHNTLAFLRAKILEGMADMDREVFIPSY